MLWTHFDHGEFGSVHLVLSGACARRFAKVLSDSWFTASSVGALVPITHLFTGRGVWVYTAKEQRSSHWASVSTRFGTQNTCKMKWFICQWSAPVISGCSRCCLFISNMILKCTEDNEINGNDNRAKNCKTLTSIKNTIQSIFKLDQTFYAILSGSECIIFIIYNISRCTLHKSMHYWHFISNRILP